MTRILEADADPNAKDYEGNTPLHLVVCNGSAECVKLLLEAGADPNTTKGDVNGDTPLHLAVLNGS
ncbi:MAG TPA: ankyrin repeat domain-containing protein, partial [Nitrospiraceae bacterium]|nr:ankyrin repeat domain-containing protein [Nitrospiraceae bacterium]